MVTVLVVHINSFLATATTDRIRGLNTIVHANGNHRPLHQFTYIFVYVYICTYIPAGRSLKLISHHGIRLNYEYLETTAIIVRLLYGTVCGYKNRILTTKISLLKRQNLRDYIIIIIILRYVIC